MSNNNYTPGPWRIGKKFPHNSLFPGHKDVTPIYWDAPQCEACGKSNGEHLVAHLFDGALPGQKSTAKANAQLIAAAPDLVNALVMAREELEFGGDWEAAKAVINRALAKAGLG